MVARLIVHAAQLGGVGDVGIEPQELGPLVALSQMNEIAAFQTIGLRGIGMLLDEAGDLAIFGAPRTKREPVIVQIRQQRVMAPGTRRADKMIPQTAFTRLLPKIGRPMAPCSVSPFYP
jgi:hypothetical protein